MQNNFADAGQPHQRAFLPKHTFDCGLCSPLCECVNMKSCMEFSIYIFIYKQDDMMFLVGRALAFVVVLAEKLHRTSLRFSSHTLHIALFM